MGQQYVVSKRPAASENAGVLCGKNARRGMGAAERKTRDVSGIDGRSEDRGVCGGAAGRADFGSAAQQRSCTASYGAFAYERAG